MARRWNARFLIPALLFAGVPLVFIAGIVVFQLVKNVPDARTARANTVLSFKTIRAANAIDEAVQDAERGQRGFLITGQEVYLDPYTKAKERLPRLMVELQQATIASADQLPRLLQLQADITTKMNELASTITAMRQQGYEAAKAIVNTDAGRLSMEAISAGRGPYRAWTWDGERKCRYAGDPGVATAIAAMLMPATAQSTGGTTPTNTRRRRQSISEKRTSRTALPMT